MSRQVLYVSGGSALSRLFERALNPLGYDELTYLPEFWRGLSELKNQEFGLIILQAPLPGLNIDDELVGSIAKYQCPVFRFSVANQRGSPMATDASKTGCCDDKWSNHLRIEL